MNRKLNECVHAESRKRIGKVVYEYTHNYKNNIICINKIDFKQNLFHFFVAS
jgi:hypothetical protein